ncbi:ABC transporter ATP-binding protein [Flavobacteriaceae bacterium TP-CH-4]|uniref:ABC transporter ATP-binding protein n=1 Tax=Pelagihabitans pacificus TaxID=2696054 RepID=A0A967ASJ4_9FLAO|nr:ABC transporter ATP-binding protein [Pelagihabitans pacificus]NHF59571.1 ABC transporter ATP-binding protein [Pelagihabitans pacificus]
MSAITAAHISKSFGEVRALQDVSLSVEHGELFGLIGPDGAGKSTLFRILTTLLLADEGEASVAGHPVVKEYKKIRRKVGYMPGKFSLYQDLSVQENLTFFATIFGTTIEANYELIQDIYVQIEPFKTRLAGKLSGGMKQKLALCCALIHKPEVLFLDEPTTGVDAVSRKEFWEMLQRLKEKGIAILVSTPYMDEAELCDRIALIQHGKILQTDSPARLRTSYTHPLYAVKAADTYRLLKGLREAIYTRSVLPFGGFLHLSTRDIMDPEQIKNDLDRKGFSNIEIKKIEATVEDVFLELSETDELKTATR